MPSPLTVTLFAFAALMTVLGLVAVPIVAASLAVLFEVVLVLLGGTSDGVG